MDQITIQFINNCDEPVQVHIKSDNISFNSPNSPNSPNSLNSPIPSPVPNTIVLPPRSSQSVPLYIITTTDNSQLYRFGTRILYKHGKKSDVSNFNISPNAQNPCVSITYRPRVMEKNGLLTLMILWLVALFLCIVGPSVLMHDTEDSPSKIKTWTIIGFVSMVIALGFSVFFIVMFTHVRRHRHEKTHANTDLNRLICKMFGTQCLSMTCV